MKHFVPLADMMQSVAAAVEEHRQLLSCYNTQLIQLFDLRDATPVFYVMFYFHPYSWEVREGIVFVYTRLGNRLSACGEHKLQRRPELGLSVLSQGQNMYTVLNEAKRKA